MTFGGGKSNREFVALRTKVWPRIVEAAILLGLMFTATWLVRP